MIGLLIQDNAYEQDIRELLMSFYPGELYAHELKDDLEFYVETALGDGTISVIIWEKDGEKEAGSDGSGDITWKPVMSRTGTSDLSDHLATKNVVKKMFYQMLVERTKKELPWGSLTGIRPTKIALTRLEEGWREQDIRSFMKETYMASDEKIDLSIEIAAREKKLLEPLDYDRGYSLYVGIPFCPTTCLYCSFTSFPISKWTGRTGLYLEALFKELEYTAKKMQGRPLDTIYFGGGTPTALPAEDIDAILCKLEQLFDKEHALEFTVEAGRPDSITEEKLKVLRDHGITRISINPQTMNQKTLDLIGRKHTVEDTRHAFALARECGFDNINMDLIVGLPGECAEDVRHTLEEVKALDPDSLTVHSLAVKRATRLHLFREQYEEMTFENNQEIMDMCMDYARESGMGPYYLYRQKNMSGNLENVGYAKPGKAGIYNILIMEEKQSILAAGAGASTKFVFQNGERIERAENVKDVTNYITRIDEMMDRKRIGLETYLNIKSGDGGNGKYTEASD